MVLPHEGKVEDLTTDGIFQQAFGEQDARTILPKSHTDVRNDHSLHTTHLVPSVL